MGEGSAIGWTNDTANCWHGCVEVSAGCKHCYAKVSTPVRVKRAHSLEVWGPSAARSETKQWAANLRKWNREARASGKVRRVFAQSLSDTFEDRGDDPCVVLADGNRATLGTLRDEFLSVIEECDALTVQMLTKRPENICAMVPPAWLKSWPAHVQIGCTAENQEELDRRMPHLARVPAAVRFLSIEPQLGHVDASRWLRPRILEANDGRWMWNTDPGVESVGGTWWWGVDWVICGGESGSKARPFDLAWARSLRDQCMAASVPYFLKQLGACPFDTYKCSGHPAPRCDYGNVSLRLHLRDSHGGDESEWPADLRGCQAFP